MHFQLCCVAWQPPSEYVVLKNSSFWCLLNFMCPAVLCPQTDELKDTLKKCNRHILMGCCSVAETKEGKTQLFTLPVLPWRRARLSEAVGRIFSRFRNQMPLQDFLCSDIIDVDFNIVSKRFLCSAFPGILVVVILFWTSSVDSLVWVVFEIIMLLMPGVFPGLYMGSTGVVGIQKTRKFNQI